MGRPAVKQNLSDLKSAGEKDANGEAADEPDVPDAKLASSSATADGKSATSRKRRVVDSDDDGDSSAGLSDAGESEAESDRDEASGSGSTTEPDEEQESKAPQKPAASSNAASKKPTKKKAKGTPAASSSKADKLETKARPELTLIDTKEGKKVPFLALCKVFEAIEDTTKRLEITALIKDFLLQVMHVDEEQLTHAVMLCITKIAPDHEGIELGIGESILIKAIGTATGRQPAKVKQDQQELGDLGRVVQRGKSNQRTMFKPKPLSISKVFLTFKEIASTSGSSSTQKKQSLIAGLLASCTDIEAKYLIRSLEGKLRIGLAESTVQTALAQAALTYETGDDIVLEQSDFQKATENLKQVLSEFPIYSTVIGSIYKYGMSDLLNHCVLTPTLPVKPMLAKIEKAADDILRRFEGKPFTCEYKYDGERSQIHYVQEEDGTSKCVVFSRNAENNTDKYPDIAGSAKEFAKASVTSFILDCEAVAWDAETGKIRSFQTLSSRKKKVGDESEIKVCVCCFVFDLLYLNGEPLIRLPLKKRRELLHESFAPVKNKFQFAVAKDLTEVEGIQEFLEQSIQDNCEGLMVKSLDGEGSSYEPSKRSQNWLKWGLAMRLLVSHPRPLRSEPYPLYAWLWLGCCVPSLAPSAQASVAGVPGALSMAAGSASGQRLACWVVEPERGCLNVEIMGICSPASDVPLAVLPIQWVIPLYFPAIVPVPALHLSAMVAVILCSEWALHALLKKDYVDGLGDSLDLVVIGAYYGKGKRLKKDYVDGLGDSLDLVVIGAYYGKGKRVGAYGAYLLACYDQDREEYQTICKIGTGFSDTDLEAHKSQLDQSVIVSPKPYYASSEKTKPDVWFEPTQVWEAGADKGISLRFPRFIRVRDDKSPDEATSSAQVAEMYESQKINQ
ncbi:ATP-dependent DNA ligase [Martensiomyces pterosporus]|nr:ATP-dependent DNA ligase [Martensiomyces pterosporus]